MITQTSLEENKPIIYGSGYMVMNAQNQRLVLAHTYIHNNGRKHFPNLCKCLSLRMTKKIISLSITQS